MAAAPAQTAPPRLNSYLRIDSKGIGPISQELRIEEFPEMLVNAVGKENLMRAVRRDETEADQKALEYSNEEPERITVRLIDFPETGSMIGRDLFGGVYFSFLVSNPHFEEIRKAREESPAFNNRMEDVDPISPITIIQKGDGFFFKESHDLNDDYASAREFLPTNDERLIGEGDGLLTKERYDAIQEIFEGRHSDLRLVAKFNRSRVDVLISEHFSPLQKV